MLAKSTHSYIDAHKTAYKIVLFSTQDTAPPHREPGQRGVT